MSRDYKSRKPAASKNGSGRLILGIFIGYMLGIVSAIGIWFYLEQAPSPFLTEQQISSYDGVDSDPDPNVDSQPNATEPPPDATAAAADEKVFDFYNILPGEDEPDQTYELPANAEQPQTANANRLVPVPPSAPVRRKQSQAVSAMTETYYLQVGSFRDNADADNLKARLALLGVIASVQSTDLSDMGTWYRVRVGPFTQKSRVEHVHNTLRENGIDAQYIKVR